jgi:hypothetical protein
MHVVVTCCSARAGALHMTIIMIRSTPPWPSRRPSRGYPTHSSERAAQLYRDAGMEPPWTRVWREGRDVTDEDPVTWPWPWSQPKQPGQR